jgi:hypothetical protein
MAMCDICQILKEHKIDNESLSNSAIKSTKVYTIFRIGNLNLCFVHDRDLFLLGEDIFFHKYPFYGEPGKK